MQTSTIRCKFLSDYVISTKQSAWRNLRGSAHINIFCINNVMLSVAMCRSLRSRNIPRKGTLCVLVEWAPKCVSWCKGVLPRNCQYMRPSDGKSKHLRVLVVRFSRFAVCQMLAYSTSSTVSLAFGKNHHNKQAQMCSQLWGWRCSTRRR